MCMLVTPISCMIEHAACAGHSAHDSPTQVIKLEISPGRIEEGVLQIVELASSAHDTRVAAMHHRSPIHTFMFDSKGALLVANASAIEACQRGTTGAGVSHFMLRPILLYLTSRPLFCLKSLCSMHLSNANNS